MARAKMPCKRNSAHGPAVRRGFCAACNASEERQRGSGWTRYGPEHRDARTAAVAALTDVTRPAPVCWRCDLPIWPGQPVVLGHAPGREVRDGYDGPGERLEHRACSDASGGRAAQSSTPT